MWKKGLTPGLIFTPKIEKFAFCGGPLLKPFLFFWESFVPSKESFPNKKFLNGAANNNAQKPKPQLVNSRKIREEIILPTGLKIVETL